MVLAAQIQIVARATCDNLTIDVHQTFNQHTKNGIHVHRHHRQSKINKKKFQMEINRKKNSFDQSHDAMAWINIWFKSLRLSMLLYYRQCCILLMDEKKNGTSRMKRAKTYSVCFVILVLFLRALFAQHGIF